MRLRRRNTTRNTLRELARVKDDLAFAVSALRCHAGPNTIAADALEALADDRPTGEAWDDIRGAQRGWGSASHPRFVDQLTDAREHGWSGSVVPVPDLPPHRDNVIPLRRT